jgi:hypothetical protein
MTIIRELLASCVGLVCLVHLANCWVYGGYNYGIHEI